jgi:hypothetical protein
MPTRLRKTEVVVATAALALVIGVSASLSAKGHQSAAGVVAGLGIGAITFFLVLATVLRSPTPQRAELTDTAIAEGLACLSRLDRVFWGRRVERVLRNQQSTVWIHVPKDGMAASTLDFVGRLWLLPCNAFVVGIVLVDIHKGQGAVTGFGWFLIGSALISFIIGVTRIVKASRSRRAFRHASRSREPT